MSLSQNLAKPLGQSLSSGTANIDSLVTKYDPLVWVRSGEGLDDVATQWDDISGNDNHILTETAPAIGNDNVGRDCPYSAGTTWMQKAIPELDRPYMVAVVAKHPSALPLAGDYVLDGIDGTHRAVLRTNAGALWEFNGGNAVTSGVQPDTDFHALVVVARANGSDDMFLDGNLVATAPAGDNDPDGVTLFSYWGGAASTTWWPGYIAEFWAVVNLADEEQARLDAFSYLGARHGLDVSTSNNTVSQKGPFQLLDHRGWADRFPENTQTAHDISIAQGAEWIEIDARASSDGVPYNYHDSTLANVRSQSGDFDTRTADQLDTYELDFMNTLYFYWTSDKYYNHVPRLEEHLDLYLNVHPMFIELKTPGATFSATVTDMLDAKGADKDMVVINGYDSVGVLAAQAAGYKACLNVSGWNGTSPTESTLSGYDFVSLNTNWTASNATVQSLAAKTKVIAGTTNTYEGMREYRELGLWGMYTNEGGYLRGQRRLTTDPYELGYHWDGCIACNSSGGWSTFGRGQHYAAGNWGFNMSAANTFVGALQGWASPIGGIDTTDGTSTLDAVTIDFEVKFESVFTDDRFAWIGLTEDDLPFVSDSGGATNHNGYNAVVRRDGQVQVYKVTNGTLTGIGYTNGTSIALGGSATYRLTVTATTIELERLDVPTTTGAIADATFRGAFMHAGTKGAYAKFDNVTITVP